VIQNDTIKYHFAHILFPSDVRRMIYTTNGIESLNKKLRKATQNKQSFEKTERLLDFLFVIIKEFETRSWMKFPVNEFANWRDQRRNYFNGPYVIQGCLLTRLAF
jgi:transposase-like protein